MKLIHERGRMSDAARAESCPSIIGLDDPAVRSFPNRIDEMLVLINTAPNAAVLLKSCSMSEMAGHVKRFRIEHNAWLRRLLLATSEELSPRKPSRKQINLVWGLHGGFTQNTGRRIWRLFRMNGVGRGSNRVNDYLRTFDTYPNESPLTSILRMSTEQQRTLVGLLIGTTDSSLLSALDPEFAENYYGPQIEAWSRDTKSAPAFINRLVDATAPFVDEDGTAEAQARNVANVCFLGYLNKVGVILLPARMIRYRWSNIRLSADHVFDNWWMDHSIKALELSKKIENTKYTVGDFFRAARPLKVMTTIQRREDISEGLLQEFRDCVPGRADIAWATRVLYDTTSGMLGLSVDVSRSAMKRSGALRKDDPFEWVTAGGPPLDRGRFSKQQARPELNYWADLIKDAMRLAGTRTLQASRRAGDLFLRYLYSLQAIPASLEDLNALDHIYDRDAPDNTLHGFLTKLFGKTSNSFAQRAKHIAHLRTLLQAVIDVRHPALSNPISDAATKLIASPRRGKTVRSALSSELVALLAERNLRDDSNFSRNIKNHYRNVFDSDKGHAVSEWFPAYSVAIAIMLELPLRSASVLWIDSGEGDENRYDHAEHRMSPNLSPQAQKGRQFGVLQMLPAVGSPGEQVVGTRISTCKTVWDPLPAFTIPWCPPSLIPLLGRMAAWVEKYVPISGPVPARRTSYLDDFLDEEVEAQFIAVYPLFRDPARRDAQALSRELLFEYWRDLCAAVEEEVNAKRPRENHIRLTRIHRKKLKPIYDLHSLRVTGITELLDAGVSPSIVQMVSGHKTLTMMLYYEKLSVGRMQQVLQHAANGRTNRIELLRDGKSDEACSGLFNLRQPDDAAGLHILRVKVQDGDASWRPFLHGLCPGADCATGGARSGNRFLPLRYGACSLCRYRLTGPDYIFGLMSNANFLMYQMRNEGLIVAALEEEVSRLEDDGRPVGTVKAEVDQARLRAAAYTHEWAMEIRYILTCEELDKAREDAGTSDDAPHQMLTPMDSEQIRVRLLERSEFALLNEIALAAEYDCELQPLFRNAIRHRDDLLEAILDEEQFKKLLLRLQPRERLRYMNRLAEAVASTVPDEELALSGLDEMRRSPPALPAVVKELYHSITGEIRGGMASANLHLRFKERSSADPAGNRKVAGRVFAS